MRSQQALEQVLPERGRWSVQRVTFSHVGHEAFVAILMGGEMRGETVGGSGRLADGAHQRTAI